MRKLKRILLVLLCLSMLTAATLPTYAVEARLNHGVVVSYDFNIVPGGVAEIALTYGGNDTSFTGITIETYIQKRSLGFIWTKVDNGEPNKTWVDSSSEQTGVFVHTLQLNSTGTYRAVFKVTFSGTGAEDDVIDNKIEDVYE